MAAILTVTYGVELLYFLDFTQLSAQSVHIVVCFTEQQPICAHGLTPCKKGNTGLIDLLDKFSYEKNSEVQ